MGGKGPGHDAASQRHREQRAEKVKIMEGMYRDGCTLQQIGDRFKITRERVRQLLRKDTDITSQNGGAAIIAARARVIAQRKRDDAAMKKWGCTDNQYKQLIALGKDMRVAGRGGERTPTRAYAVQKRNARVRKIGWDLSLWDWWKIWERSGKWNERGRGQGYVMARVADEGPYAIGNVFITTAIDNSSHALKKRKYDLPCGVSVKTIGAYRAYIARRCISGKIYHVGSFKTPELAHAAYLAFTPPAQAAA